MSYRRLSSLMIILVASLAIPSYAASCPEVEKQFWQWLANGEQRNNFKAALNDIVLKLETT